MNYSKRLHDIKAALNDLHAEIPDLSNQFGDLHQTAIRSGVIPKKYKELMALSISIATQCEGGIAYHISDAVEAGANKEEILESIAVAIYMGGGPALMYAADAYTAYHQILNETVDYGEDDTFID